MFDMLAQSAKVALTIDVALPLAQVSIDRLRVQHVLFSLFQNALDVSVQNAAAPWVKFGVRAEKYAVEISVTDSGRGIAPETRNRIFKPFFTTKPQGTGLGLASSRAIIEAHEGTIGFEADPAGGTRFWFRLPVSE